MKVVFPWLLVVVVVGKAAEATFVIQPQSQQWKISRTLLAATKGFGNTQKEDRDNPTVKDDATATTPTTPPLSKSSSGSNSSPRLNAGQMALEKLRREQQEKRDEELRKVREIRDVDKMLQDSPESGVIPEKVASRMGARMLPFVGIPLFGSLATFVGFWYLTTVKNLDIQPTVVATTTSFLMVASLLGITYSVLSASWEPDQDGSLLGVEEFKQNLGNVRDGLTRSRENLLIREKMKGLPEEEINAALAELERREVSQKKDESFESKINKELD